MAFNILHRRIYLVRLIYDWSRSDFPEEPRKESVALPSPVIYIQKRIPAEDQFGIWLLLEYGSREPGLNRLSFSTFTVFFASRYSPSCKTRVVLQENDNNKTVAVDAAVKNFFILVNVIFKFVLFVTKLTYFSRNSLQNLNRKVIFATDFGKMAGILFFMCNNRICFSGSFPFF